MIVGGVLSVVVGVLWHGILVVAGANILVGILFPVFGPRSPMVALVGTVAGLSAPVVLVWW